MPCDGMTREAAATSLHDWLAALVGKLLGTCETPLPQQPGRGAPLRVLLVTAHPDDECMFFTPTVASLTAAGVELWLLCLSLGDAEGLGPVRDKELLASCKILQIPAARVITVDHPALQDGMRMIWPPELVASHVSRTVQRTGAATVVTFDEGGVSGHINHKAVYRGVRLYLAQQAQGEDARLPNGSSKTGPAVSQRRRNVTAAHDEVAPVTAWQLETTGWWRTFVGLLDVFQSALRTRLRRQRGLAAACCTARDPCLAWRAMSAHASQLLWYRRLFIRLSRYSYINTLTAMAPWDAGD